MTTAAEPKILRIGIIQGGKVIEERLVRKRTTVTVGTEEGNVFVLSGLNLPRSWPLFEMKGDAYHLVFDEVMDGRVSIDGEKGIKARAQESNIDFAGLKEHGKAEKQSDRYRFELDDTSRGRVQIASDLTILFHFVAPPPQTPRPELPPTVKRGFIRQVEPIFTMVLAGSFLVHTAVALMVRYVEAPPPPSAEDLRVLIQKITPPKIDVPLIPPKADPTAVAVGVAPAQGAEAKGAGGDGSGKKGSGGASGKGTGGGSGGVGPSRDDVRAAIAGKGLMALIGASGGGSGAISNVFGSGSAIDSDVGAALQGTAGVGIAGGADGVTRRGSGGGGASGDGTGGGGGGAASIGDLGGGGGGGSVATGTKEVARVAARVMADDVEAVDGKIDKRSVAEAIRRRQAAFQQCYETALKADSKLQGKLVVEFTIDEQGRVSEASVVKDALGSGDVSRCVVATLKRIRFPTPADGEVTVSNTFVFQPGGSG